MHLARMIRLMILTLVFALVATGCASRPKVDRNRDWQPLVGHYTYEVALMELGRPLTLVEQSDGRKFAEWITHRSPRMSFGFGVGGASIGPHSSVGVGVGTEVSPPTSDEYLRLNFAPNGLLESWSKVRH